jgi:flagellar hook-associated protein 1 FlgK
MAGLLDGISTMAHSLNAQQAGLQTAGRNLANANNAAYARQRVHLGDRTVIQTPLGTQGTGVEALTLQQMRDGFLDANVTSEISRTALLQAQQSAFSRAETGLGEQVDRSASSASISDASSTTTGISSAVNDFFNGWEGLSANPTGMGARQVVLQKAAVLTDKFNMADQRLASLQGDLTSAITGGVADVNGVLKQIAGLNKAIGAAEAGAPGTAADLRDQRQALLETLASSMDFTTQPLAGSSGQIEVLACDSSGGTFALVQGDAVRGGLTFTGTGFTSGIPPVALAFQSGSLAGNLSARDGTVAGLRDNLQKAAQQLTSSVNAAYNPGGTGADFFQVPPTSGLLALNPALTSGTLRTGVGGDSGANDIALAVGALAGKTFSTTSGDLISGTITGFVGSTVTGHGAALAAVNARLSDQQSVQQLVTDQRNAVSRVSMDEEMADLMKYQRAYESSARVVSSLDTLLDTLINRLRA